MTRLTKLAFALVPLALLLSMGQVSITRGWNMGYFSDGSAAAPSLTFSGDPDTGFFRSTANQISVTLGGTERIVFFGGGGILLKDTFPELAFGAAQDLRLFRSGAGIISFTDADLAPDLKINVAGAPTLSTCGTGPTLATGSSNSVGRVTTGTTGTACTLTFSTGFGGNAADCTITNLTAFTRGAATSMTSTAFTVTGLTAADTFVYHCFGR